MIYTDGDKTTNYCDDQSGNNRYVFTWKPGDSIIIERQLKKWYSYFITN